MMIKSLLKNFIFLISIFLVSCASRETLKKEAFEYASKYQFTPHVFRSPDYEIQGLIKKGKSDLPLHVYIEGDGLAWVSRYEVSVDPTPPDPMGLKLACSDQSPSTIIYLSRPGQFLINQNCSFIDWTNGRFSKKIIQNYMTILADLKRSYGAKTFKLFGYSGGASVALLLAASRSDIQKVTTFAGLLDHRTWTKMHGCAPLDESLSPIDYIPTLSKIEQYHYIGGEDNEVSIAMAKQYQEQFQDKSFVHIISVPDYNHYSNWPSFWHNAQGIQ